MTSTTQNVKSDDGDLVYAEELVSKLFTYHPPSPKQIPKYNELRDRAKVFAKFIVQSCPESRERSLAITNLQQVVMWANASIAINESE